MIQESDKMQIAEFFAAFDELFELKPIEARQSAKKRSTVKNRDKVFFTLPLEQQQAQELQELCKALHIQPTVVLTTLLRDYLLACRIKNN